MRVSISLLHTTSTLAPPTPTLYNPPHGDAASAWMENPFLSITISVEGSHNVELGRGVLASVPPVRRYSFVHGQ